MGFLLRIYFIGLIAFVPGQNGREMTILMVDARQSYAVSDGTMIEPHVPILVARSGSCAGDCRQDAQQVADYLFQKAEVMDQAENLRQLESALSGGGAWILDSSDLSFETSTSGAAREQPRLDIRGTRRDQRGAWTLSLSQDPEETFAWVADVGKLDPAAEVVDPDVLAKHPQKGLVVARAKLTEGWIGTHRLVTFKDRIVRLAFEPLRDPGRRADYSQRLGDRVVAEVRIPGCSVRISEKSFVTGETRALDLAPERCDGEDVIEVALVNLPASSFEAASREPPEPVGKHFEMYYELSNMRPPNRLRPVPVVSEVVETAAVPLVQDAESPLLLAIGLPWRGILDRPICPTAMLSEGQ